MLARLRTDSKKLRRRCTAARRAQRFFDWHGAWPPEECADETLDRLVLKLESGFEIVDVRRYALGIARLVLLGGSAARNAVERRSSRACGSTASVSMDYEDEPLHACFDRCLAALPADSRTLVLGTAPPSGGQRSTIAAVSRRHSACPSALRNRVQRVRDRLEAVRPQVHVGCRGDRTRRCRSTASRFEAIR